MTLLRYELIGKVHFVVNICSRKMFPFKAPSTFSITGATGSGKTSWLFKLLRNREEMFGDNPPSNILYCYGVWQELFEQMEEEIPNIVFLKGLPSLQQIEEFSGSKHNIIILDDLMEECVKNPEVENLFTRGAHHKKLSVIYINQNMFCQGKNAKSISLNTHYIILLQNLRDQSQIRRLGQQIFPGQGHLLLEAYKESLQSPFGYLVIDLAPNTVQKYRLRTNIFPGEGPPIIFLPHGTV